MGEPSAASNHALLGAMLDNRYQVTAHIGQGGMSSVFSAVQIGAVQREVAVKVLNISLADRPSVLERFESEARIISELRHPNTLRLVDSGRLPDGRLYFVTERLRGDPLDALIKKGPLGFTRTLRLVEQICGALAEAHAHGIIHRDIKPSNIFVEKVAGREMAKVLDFGIAKVESAPGLTNPQDVIGTPGYMSPEQCRGEPLDPRSDLYSLGVVFFECLAGRPPFRSESANPVALMLLHLKEEAPRLSTFPHLENIEPEIERLVAQLLEKSPAARPGSAEHVEHIVSEASSIWNHGPTKVSTSSLDAEAPRPEIHSPEAYAPTLVRPASRPSEGDDLSPTRTTELRKPPSEMPTASVEIRRLGHGDAEPTDGGEDRGFDEATATGRTMPASMQGIRARSVAHGRKRRSRQNRVLLGAGIGLLLIGLGVLGLVGPRLAGQRSAKPGAAQAPVHEAPAPRPSAVTAAPAPAPEAPPMEPSVKTPALAPDRAAVAEERRASRPARSETGQGPKPAEKAPEASPKQQKPPAPGDGFLDVPTAPR